MAKSQIEEKIDDLNIDFLISVSNAALTCPDTKEAYRYGLTSVACAIVITTGPGRWSLNQMPIPAPETLSLLNIYYNLAKQKGVYGFIKNEERPLPNKKDATPTAH